MSIRRKKCRNCRRFFIPDRYNHYHQVYCGSNECRKASKKASQARWLNKPENRNYHHGPEHVKRVSEWRLAHPGYWQDHVRRSAEDALQDFVFLYLLMSESLFAYFSGGTLRDFIVPFIKSLYNNGRRLRNTVARINKETQYETGYRTA